MTRKPWITEAQYKALVQVKAGKVAYGIPKGYPLHLKMLIGENGKRLRCYIDDFITRRDGAVKLNKIGKAALDDFDAKAQLKKFSKAVDALEQKVANLEVQRETMKKILTSEAIAEITESSGAGYFSRVAYFHGWRSQGEGDTSDIETLLSIIKRAVAIISDPPDLTPQEAAIVTERYAQSQSTAGEPEQLLSIEAVKSAYGSDDDAATIP